MKNNIYVLMKEDRSIPDATRKLILEHIANHLAKIHLNRCLELCREQLAKSHIHILQYANLTLCCVRIRQQSPRNIRLDNPFINQSVHDMGGYNKISHF